MDFSIRPLTLDDLGALRSLFRLYPHKARQQKKQGMDPDVLADFFAGGEERRLKKTDADAATDRWVVEEDQMLGGIAGLNDDAWHSEIYGWRFGRVAPFLTHRASRKAGEALLDTALDYAREKKYQHLSTRVDGADFAATQILESRNFYIVDSSVKLSARLDDIPNVAPPSSAGGMTLRPFDPSDREAVCTIAAESHSINHFFNDPWLKRDDSERLFGRWVERCCDGLASEVFVLERKGRVEGFAIYLSPAGLNKALSTRIAILDFICLAPAARGGGVGRWMVSQTAHRLAGKPRLLELRTSHHNYAALGCYLSLGMEPVANDFILHRHLE